MSLTSIGDLAQTFVTRRNNTDLKQRLNSLTAEMSSGQVSDLTRHLGGDRSRLTAIERNLGLLDGYAIAATETAQSLSVMQTALSKLDDTRETLANGMATITSSSSESEVAKAVASAKDGFDTMQRLLNTRLADKSLFAGTGSQTPALSDTMLADLTTALSGLTDVDDITAAVDTWFDDPAGGFATSGYLGETSNMTRRIDDRTTVTIGIRADDAALREVLKGAALGAIAGDLGLATEDRAALIRKGAETLLGAGQDLALAQGTLGIAEGRIEDAQAAQSARRTAWNAIRNDMVNADPYETATALQEVTLQLETHYTLTARLASLSLTEYLR